MLTKTSCIVLRTIKYSDKSSIVTVYSREFGRVSYIVYGLNRKKSGVKAACFLPLSIIEITAIYHPGKDLQQLKEVRILNNLTSIYTHPLKNALSLFTAELLYKTLKQPESEKHIFDFLEQTVLLLEQNETQIANFHLIFMIKLSGYLGFEPNQEEKNAQYFDLMNGIFLTYKPLHSHFLSVEMSALFNSLLYLSFESGNTLVLSREKRNELLNVLIEYYKLHVPEFYGLNSVSVLHEIFN
ncbi:MAG: DNA repair protein RecO [Paludibacter sp.]|nr:DNA repair protein RecO [Paludibacter sp.]